MCKIYYALLVTSSALIVAGMGAVLQSNIDIDRLSPGDSLGGNFPSSLSFVGTVAGKSYFADNDTNLNWVAAGKYCKDLGMELATITSANQAQLLNQSWAEHFRNYFWTAGRDAHELRQFSWDKTGEELSSEYLELIGGRAAHLRCLQYWSNARQSGLFSESCSEREGTLCEIMNA